MIVVNMKMNTSLYSLVLSDSRRLSFAIVFLLIEDYGKRVDFWIIYKISKLNVTWLKDSEKDESIHIDINENISLVYRKSVSICSIFDIHHYSDMFVWSIMDLFVIDDMGISDPTHW